jgi:DNA-binding IclR family transcriptional regulator
MNTPAYAGTQAIVRSLRLLKLFHARPELSFAEIHERAGLNRSTVFRILSALTAEGMLERDPATDVYRIGPTIVGLGRRPAPLENLIERARGEMDSLARTINETITLEMLAGDEVVIVAETMGSHVIGALPSLGTSWPAHLTSTGKVLLAALDPSDVDDRLPATAGERDDFVRELRGVRQRGWAENYEELEPGFVAVAVPVLDANGRTVAALSLGGPKQRLSRRRLPGLAQELAQAARRITGELGRDRP